jgi:quinoprotein glucose dehydrogenase
MTNRGSLRRAAIWVGLIGVAAAGFAAWPAGLDSAPQSATKLVRGNAPGEWRYWGADAWSTRYSPLDQINASNFSQLQEAWRWNAAVDGPDEYYRTTPLYANGKLFTLATTSLRLRDRSGTGKTTWSWKCDGYSLAESPTVRGRGLAMLDRQPGQRARHCRHARLPHGHSRRQTGAIRRSV